VAEELPISLRWLTLWFGIPTRQRLASGVLWRAENDAAGRAILRGRFEQAEQRFVERYLTPGMTVLDIGAHHGFYTLLASKKVGPGGRVVAFEPSPRERERLERHVKWNEGTNVAIEGVALGETAGSAELFLVHGKETGCNSLRAPQNGSATMKIGVKVARLEDYLGSKQIGAVDFVKMDVEGGELGVLRGSGGFFEREPRPVVLCEVQDVRTAAWGYRASEIIGFLERAGLRWFAIREDGSLEAVSPSGQNTWDGNFVAAPAERFERLREAGLLVS
jgi:FkbM family methyltransferase